MALCPAALVSGALKSSGINHPSSPASIRPHSRRYGSTGITPTREIHPFKMIVGKAETPGQVTNSQVKDRDFKVLLQAEWHRRGIGTGQGSIRGLGSVAKVR